MSRNRPAKSVAQVREVGLNRWVACGSVAYLLIGTTKARRIASVRLFACIVLFASAYECFGQYHTVDATTGTGAGLTAATITVYLDIQEMGDCQASSSTTPVELILQQLIPAWTNIGQQANVAFTVNFVFGPNTRLPVSTTGAVQNTILVGGANYTIVTAMTAPAGVRFFLFKVGCGLGARDAEKASRISYVVYGQGEGYLFVNLPVTAWVGSGIDNVVGHELGHVLGLSDRYCMGVCWSDTRVIDRTPWQIWRGKFVDDTGEDTRNGTTATGGRPLPYLANATPLALHNQMIPLDPAYQPLNNLMSIGSGLTRFQMNIIASRQTEPTYGAEQWVALLGECNPTTRVVGVSDPTTAIVVILENMPIGLQPAGWRSCWRGLAYYWPVGPNGSIVAGTRLRQLPSMNASGPGCAESDAGQEPALYRERIRKTRGFRPTTRDVTRGGNMNWLAEYWRFTHVRTMLRATVP
jgi:hypothetical protein